MEYCHNPLQTIYIMMFLYLSVFAHKGARRQVQGGALASPLDFAFQVFAEH